MARCTPLILIALLFSACAARPVWKQRDAPIQGEPGHTQVVPTCPDCGQVLDWETDECVNPDKKTRINWSEPESLD